jgi:beta-lactamase regulating signal transducer with metallopeptidase domain
MDWQMLAWSRLADAAAGGLIVLTIGSLAARLCRQPVRRARIVVLTLLGGMAVPCLSALPVAPHWSAGLLPAPAVPRAHADVAAPTDATSRLHLPEAPGSRVTLEPTERAGEPASGAARSGHAVFSPGSTKPSSERRWALPGTQSALLACYFAMSAGLAAWWFVGQLLLWRVVRVARPVPSVVRDIFRSLAGAEGDQVILLESDRIAKPLTFTWLRPVILLPKPLCDGHDTGALRYVLAHEWSHVERRDAWAWNLACVAGLVLFYQPLFWWLRRQLRLCQDYLADARAAAVGSAEDYAAFLVRLARARRSGPIVPALGIGDRRSNLYRRVIMLVQNHEPLERRCQAAWSIAVLSAAAVVIVAASGLRLNAEVPHGPVSLAKEVQAVKNDAQPPGATDKSAETLHYKGTVVNKDTGQPIAGATVVVRRSILRSSDNRVLQETKHTTGADGMYAFEIPPDQHASPYLYIELDVEHPDYATRDRFGYALSMTRKNEKLNERPFFERVEMRPAKPITGRVETPEGEPAVGMVVLAYSRTDKGGQLEYGSFARAETDAQGRFRLPITTPGQAAYWVLPKAYAPELYVIPEGKRGDIGTTTLKKGVSVAGRVLNVQGKPIAGVFVEIERKRGSGADLDAQNLGFISNVIRRIAETDADGRFTFDPLPPGEYSVVPSESDYDGDRKKHWTHRPLPEVFTSTKLTIKEGETTAPLEIRASPTVVIEGHWVDSKGQPKGGWSSFVFGKMDGSFWSGQAHPDHQGRFSLKVPHGLEDVQVDISTNEHATTRHRIGKDGPLVEGRTARLGTLDHDVKDIEIVRYVSPIIVINATTKDGKQVPGFKADVEYKVPAGPERGKQVHVVGGGPKKDALQDEQYDGRYRTSTMLPDKEVKVTVSADGFKEASRNLTLPEGKTEEVTFVLEPK